MGLLVCVATVVVGVPIAGAVPPPPPNPSDGDIAAAAGQVDNGTNEVGALINDVASVGQQIEQLDSVVAAKREAVNKALVDLQSARDAADSAATTAAGTERALTDSGTAVQQARANFDKFAIQVYESPGSNSMVSYLSGGANPSEALDRAQVLSAASRSADTALDGMRRAQVQRANADSAARSAKQAAEAAAAGAESKKSEAENAVTSATAAVDAESAQRDALNQQRDVAQQRLDAARQRVSGLQGQREAYNAWDQQRRDEEIAAAAAVAAAAVRAAADAAARERAQELNDSKRDHTDLDDTPPPRRSITPTRPAGSASQLIETVVDRAMSQLGVTYAWGGGDEDGPTKGIRDGGVADRYGDYKKVGFDCSGLMVYAFAGVGISLPHYSGYQYQMGTRVPVAQRQRGDMLFWGRSGSEHVAMYLGDGKMIEAPESGDVVKISAVRENGMMPNAVRLIT